MTVNLSWFILLFPLFHGTIQAYVPKYIDCADTNIDKNRKLYAATERTVSSVDAPASCKISFILMDVDVCDVNSLGIVAGTFNSGLISQYPKSNWIQTRAMVSYYSENVPATVAIICNYDMCNVDVRALIRYAENLKSLQAGRTGETLPPGHFECFKKIVREKKDEMARQMLLEYPDVYVTMFPGSSKTLNMASSNEKCLNTAMEYERNPNRAKETCVTYLRFKPYSLGKCDLTQRHHVTRAQRTFIDDTENFLIKLERSKQVIKIRFDCPTNSKEGKGGPFCDANTNGMWSDLKEMRSTLHPTEFECAAIAFVQYHALVDKLVSERQLNVTIPSLPEDANYYKDKPEVESQKSNDFTVVDNTSAKQNKTVTPTPVNNVEIEKAAPIPEVQPDIVITIQGLDSSHNKDNNNAEKYLANKSSSSESDDSNSSMILIIMFVVFSVLFVTTVGTIVIQRRNKRKREREEAIIRSAEIINSQRSSREIKVDA